MKTLTANANKSVRYFFTQRGAVDKPVAVRVGLKNFSAITSASLRTPFSRDGRYGLYFSGGRMNDGCAIPIDLLEHLPDKKPQTHKPNKGEK